MQRPSAVQMTDAAAGRAKDLLAKGGDDVLGLRVGVKSGGCSGFTYVVEYATDQRPFEEVVEDKGVRLYIDPKAIMYLLGTEMDYTADKFQSGFVFRNPNAKDMCGCGESFSV